MSRPLSLSSMMEDIGSHFWGIFAKPAAALVGSMLSWVAYLGSMEGFWNGLGKPYKYWMMLGGAIVIDTVCAIFAAKKNGEPITVERAWGVIYKLVAFGALIFVVWMIGTISEAPREVMRQMVVWALGGLSGIEGLSILDNIGKLKIKRLQTLIAWARRFMNKEQEKFKEKETE